MQAAYDRISKEAVGGVYGQRVIPQTGPGTDDTRPDFPYIEDPSKYTTHVPLEMDEVEDEVEPDKIREQDEEKEPLPGEAGEEAGAEIGAETPMPGGEAMPDAGLGGTGMDVAGNMPGVMPPAEEELKSSEIGRVYELKKIYSRLASVETYLARTTDAQMLEIRKLVGQSIDLFEVVISNFPQYKDKVDEIIVTYYEFLESVYESLTKYFKDMSEE